MVGQLDQISRVIGNIETELRGIKDRAEEDRQLGNQRHVENQDAIKNLTIKLDNHAKAVLIPGSMMSRRRMTGLAAIGVSALGAAGLVVETGLKFSFNWVLSHLH